MVVLCSRININKHAGLSNIGARRSYISSSRHQLLENLINISIYLKATVSIIIIRNRSIFIPFIYIYKLAYSATCCTGYILVKPWSFTILFSSASIQNKLIFFSVFCKWINIYNLGLTGGRLSISTMNIAIYIIFSSWSCLKRNSITSICGKTDYSVPVTPVSVSLTIVQSNLYTL